MVQEQKNGDYLILSSIAADLREKGYNARLDPVTKQEAYDPNLRPECNIKITDSYTIVLRSIEGRIWVDPILNLFSTRCFDMLDPRSVYELYLYIELFEKLIRHKQFVDDPHIQKPEQIRRHEDDLEIQARIMREHYIKQQSLKCHTSQ